MRRILLGTTFALGLASLAHGPASAKTARECDAEYAASKAGLQGVQKKAEFVAACRAGADVPLGAAPVAPSAARPQPNALRKPSAAELAEQRKLERDMNICIGC